MRIRALVKADKKRTMWEKNDNVLVTDLSKCFPSPTFVIPRKFIIFVVIVKIIISCS